MSYSGYKQGTTKAIVKMAHEHGFTRQFIAEQYGLSYCAIYSCEYRIKLFLKSDCNKEKQGVVKAMATKALNAGMTFKGAWESLKNTGVNYESLYSAWRGIGGLGVKQEKLYGKTSKTKKINAYYQSPT